jgi:neutral ceramidase
MSPTHLKLGRAELAITPPLGISMAGYYYDRKADNIYGDLYARALVFSHGNVRAAVVLCDLIGLGRDATAPIRQEIERRAGIPGGNVLIACTHTHTGPLTADWPENQMQADPAYMKVLSRRIADAVVLAASHLRPASAWVAHGSVEGIAFNRRYWMKDGSLRTNPPFQSPDIVRPAGPLDTDLGLLLLRGFDGEPAAFLTNYALHPDQVGGTALGADYEGVMVGLLKTVLGEDCAVLCTNGCAGDINHFDMTRPGPQSEMACALRSGRALSGEAIRRLSDLNPLEAPSLRAASRTLSLPLRLPSPEEVEWARQLAGQPMTEFDQRGLDIVAADRMLELHARGESQVPAEVSAIALGELALVGLPGEIFAQLGIEIKRCSPFRHTFVIELCNDSIGYLPPRQVYAEGGYEAASSPFAPGDGELLVDAVVEMLEGLRGQG